MSVNVFIPLDAQGERLRGPAAKGTPMPKRVESRTVFDPLASRNLSNCLPAARRSGKAIPQSFAPKGWRLRTVDPQPIAPPKEGSMPDSTRANYRLCTLGDASCLRRDGHKGECRPYLTRRQARRAAREATANG